MFTTIKDAVSAIKERDPAATNTLSALINYPGLHALLFHRWHHWLHVHGLRFLARWGSQVARWLTGIEIHPGATIGRRFFIDHGMGVVIGETTIIGDDVTLYQGVTLGGTGKETGKRHPTLLNGVTVGVDAIVLGAITLGERCKVGGGAVVVHDVPADCTVVGIPARAVIRRSAEERDRLRRTRNLVAPELPHEDLPDPIIDVFATLLARIKRLEGRCGVPLERDPVDTESYLFEIEQIADTMFQDGAGI
ncbi:MAG: serine O-acetyltransferase [Actinomycetes bacterium]|jgi:serine O-acetyltransferase|nr:serine O-acetyltransferase [Actinomycetes bacterium]